MSIKVGIVGQGCAGMATAFHLLKKTHVPLTIDLLDAHPLGSGATGVAAGLLHPLAPSGKPLWHGMTSFEKATSLVRESSQLAPADGDPFWRTTGLFRPATTDKQRRQFQKNIGWEPREDLLGAHCTTIDGLGDGFYLPDGMILDTKRYLHALWDACHALATTRGCTLTAHRISINALEDLRHAAYDATVVAAGAAVQDITELRHAMQLDLCQGYTVEMSKKERQRDDTPSHPENAAIQDPSILGQPYIAFQASSRAIVGATQRHGLSPTDARHILAHSQDIHTPDAIQNASTLAQTARQTTPYLDHTWHITAVRSGVRAIPTRTHLGTIPYAGRLTAPPHADTWILAGLGARGLVYHALLGELTADAILQDAPNHIAFAAYPELTRWIA